MSFASADDTPGWGAGPSQEVSIKDTLRKDKLVRCVVTVARRDETLIHSTFYSDIISVQENLRGESHDVHSLCLGPSVEVISKALLTKARSVQDDVDKLTSGNETLQMYIDNLTMQMAKRR